MTYPVQPSPDPSAPPPPLQYAPAAPAAQPAPPPGYPQQYAQPGYPAPAASRSPQQKALAAVGIWGALAVVGVVCGISIPENDRTQWSSVHAWGALAIVATVLTLVPAVADSLSLPPSRGWQIATGGAGLLVFYWVLLVLPSTGSNMSLVTTVGVICGCIAAALAPGRPVPAPR
jgi:hypothetical protein